MPRNALVFIFAVLVAAAANAAGPRQLQVDLAVDPGTERTFQVQPGDYTLLVVSKVPQFVYSIQIEESFIPIQPLTPPGPGANLIPSDPCLDLTTATGKVNRATDEKVVAENVAKIEQLLASGSCNRPPEIADAKAALSATRELLPDAYHLDNNQELKVTVTRGAGTDAKRWTYIYRTPERGHWFSSYGFVFIPNHDQTYFSKAVEGESGKFTVTRKQDRKVADFAPSLFFSWLARVNENSDWSFSWSAGLGFDQSNPVVFVGPMWTYNQNVSIVGGLVFHKQKRLNGIYTSNEPVMENLTEAQLTEETYRPNFFLGLSFRFSSNPFSSSSNSNSKPSPAAPKTTKNGTTSGASGNNP